jgi:aspartate carbamoyltransferase catalytic subunit
MARDMDILLAEIEAFCREHGLSETRFGELALHDKPFVSQLRAGRDLRASTAARLRQFMAAYRSDAEPARRQPARFPEGALAFPHQGLLGIAGLANHEILFLLDEAEQWVELNRQPQKRDDRLAGLTIINAFFENSTRTLLSFEIAGKRLGADVVNMLVAQSSVKKGETLIDTAMTLNAMRADAIVIRHGSSGAVRLIAEKVDCPVLNAGDGQHEHPTQGLLDALTIRHAKGSFSGLTVTICGDILHSRVARSNMLCLTALGAEVRVCAPPALMPAEVEEMKVTAFHDFDAALRGADVVMMLRLQQERMAGQFIPSPREYRHLYGLTLERLAKAKGDALVMHPGPMNRGIEIDSNVADMAGRSLITRQVEMGVAIRMACLDVLTRKGRGVEGWA